MSDGAFQSYKGKQYGIFEYRKYVYFSVCNRRGRVPFSYIALGEQKTIINGGDVETGVVIRLNALGTVKNPKIYNVDTIDRMILNVTMQAGDEITINTRKRKVNHTST